MKKSRRLSFFVVSLVYVLAIILGVIVYNVLDFHFAINLLIADVLATILVFIFSLIFKNASVYDPYWSVQPIVIVLAYCFKCDLTIYRILPLIAICLWGIRLTANWAYTFKSLEHQDWRYTMLKEKALAKKAALKAKEKAKRDAQKAKEKAKADALKAKSKKAAEEKAKKQAAKAEESKENKDITA